MPKRRMRKKDEDGLLAANAFAGYAMVPEFSEHLSKHDSFPTLAELLVALMNGDTLPAASKQRVQWIIQLLRIQKECERLATRLDPRDQVGANKYAAALLKFNLELNERLVCYKVTPQIIPAGTPTLYFLSAEWSSQSPEENAEVSAVMCVLQLVQQSHTDNLRACLCGTFFVAGRIDQQHCSTKCRVKAHQSSEEFKAKRREADRER